MSRLVIRKLWTTAGLLMAVTVASCKGPTPTESTPTTQLPPTVTALDPLLGSADGGTKITITGTGFTNVDFVKVGDKTVAFNVLSETSITATDPGGGPGTTDVVVITAGGSSPVGDASKFVWDPNELTELTLSNNVVTVGSAVTVSMALKYASPGVGVRIPIRLVSTPAQSAVVVPASILVPAGGTSATFQALALFVSTKQQVELTLEHGSITRSVQFTVQP